MLLNLLHFLSHPIEKIPSFFIITIATGALKMFINHIPFAFIFLNLVKKLTFAILSIFAFLLVCF